ncbi:MAG: DUF3127 domain-containing protein [Acidobacteriota bacterium]
MFRIFSEDGKYSQDINLEFLQDKVSLLDSISVGQEIKVFFDIRGREYNGRYFNNLVGWKIEGKEGAADSQTPMQDEVEASGELDDDIPF